MADGRAFVLVRGRDFFLNPREVEEAAANAAARLGKAVQTIRTLRASVLSIWVQFADYRVEFGAPCPCGSDDLRRVNDQWAVCASCEATLLVESRPKASVAAGGVSVAVADDEERDGAERLRIFVPEGGPVGNERKRLAALRGAEGDAEPKLKPAGERKEAHAREREEKKAQVRETRDETRRERHEARQRQREQQRQQREADRDVRPASDSGPKLRTLRRKTPAPPQGGGGSIDRFSNVRLWPSDAQQPGRYWGYGYDPKGRLMLLEVTLELTPDGAAAADPGQPGRALHSVSAVRSGLFAAAVDTDALLARTDGLSADDVLGLPSR